MCVLSQNIPQKEINLILYFSIRNFLRRIYLSYKPGLIINEKDKKNR